MSLTPEQMEDMRRSVKRIEVCLLGDKEMGQFGLVARVNNHAGRIKRIEVWAGSIIGGSVTLGIIYKIVVDFWPHR